jgi:translocation and assembly module TamB
VASFPEAVRQVNGKVTFSARRVLLEDFTAKVAGGRVGLRGEAALEGRGIGGYDLQLEAENIGLKPRDGIALEFDGRGKLSWKRGDRLPLLSGLLRIDEFAYTRPIEMERTLGEMYGPERAEVQGYDPEADLLAIDIQLEQQKPLYIRNNLIDAELRLVNDKLPFRLLGTDQRFGLLGNMSVRKGTVRFRETTFDIRQGDIHFGDETRIDPNFDLRATTDVERQTGQTDWHIEIHAFGNRDQFQFELSSDPYLTEDDIALLLTMGMTQSELAQVDTSDLTSTAALEALATVTGVEREVQRALPQIDDFHIASSYSELSNRTEPQLVIGKRIAENVRLRASTGIAESRDFGAGVELQLNDKTSVQAVYNNQNSESSSQIGDVGVDLKWRLEFD